LLRRGNAGGDAPTFMELLARDQQIALGGDVFRRGERQMADNLGVVLERFRKAHVAVFVASQASNLRDQPPFASRRNAGAQGADSVFAQAQRSLARGDTAAARVLFRRARDLDVVRFRAPTAFDSIIHRVATANGAVYVPVAERFAAASPGGIPGHDLFLEHLHPNERGATLIAHCFFDAIAASGFLGHQADTGRVRPWEEYGRRMALTPFDERIVEHSVRTVTERWPFVPVAKQVDYRRSYRPTTLLDSLALAVAAGAPWTAAKVRLAQSYEQRGFADSAAAELAGVVRDSPMFAEPWELYGRALAAAHRPDSAAAAFDRSLGIRPTPGAAAGAGALALERKDAPRAIALFRQALAMRPDDPAVLYRLSLAYALTHDAANARAVAWRLHAVAPEYPGLAEWLRLLGVTR
jgi:tetratricopeptide (TPR) repeat protein